VIDAEWVQELIEVDEPIEAVWRAMVKVWETENLPTDLKGFYDEREGWMYRLERFLLDLFPEIYDILLSRSVAQDGGYVRKRLVENNVVVIADSLSVREAVLLRHYFPGLDFVPDEPFAIAPFPTSTESLSQKLLNTIGPSSGRDTADFAYRYIAGGGVVDQQDYPSNRPLLVWVRLPDVMLEQVSEAQTTKIDGVFEETKKVLGEIFQRLEGRRVFITSDHGYFYGALPNQHFEEPDRKPEGVDVNKRVFDGLSLRGAMKEYFVVSGEHAALKSRYWWRGKGQNAPHTSHGGFSLAEVFVPVLQYEASG